MERNHMTVCVPASSTSSFWFRWCRTVRVADVAALSRPVRWRRWCDPDVVGTAPGLAWSAGFWSAETQPAVAASPHLHKTPAAVKNKRVQQRKCRRTEGVGGSLFISCIICWLIRKRYYSLLLSVICFIIRFFFYFSSLTSENIEKK